MLELRGIYKAFGNQQALADVSFQIKTGEIVALLGPSGSGKSTLLSIVAGLETPDRGQVLWGGKELAEVPSHRRGFGLMFQDYALFPHRDVFGNVAFGLQMAGTPKADLARRVSAVLELVGLSHFVHREVSSLSGGEQQRVALARALAPQPALLMLDEPLGSLDRALRTRLLDDLAHILRASAQASLYVTHDQEEAYAIADRVALFNQGRLLQIGSPEDLYLNPASVFAAKFLGMENVWPSRLEKKGRRAVLHTPIGELPGMNSRLSGEVFVLLRPDEVQIGKRGAFTLNGTLLSRRFRGSVVLAEVQVGQTRLKLQFPYKTLLPEVGSSMQISFDPEKAIQVFSREQ